MTVIARTTITSRPSSASKERRRPRGERGLRTHGHVEHYEDNRLNRDPAQDVADCDPEVVRERRRGGDRDLRQVRRDRKQDCASEGFP